MKFNSQICTSREQSERLLALGLKPETADMAHEYVPIIEDWIKTEFRWEGQNITEFRTPAWSLHRLIKRMPQIIGHLELAINDEFVGYYEDRCESETQTLRVSLACHTICLLFYHKRIKYELFNRKYENDCRVRC